MPDRIVATYSPPQKVREVFVARIEKFVAKRTAEGGTSGHVGLDPNMKVLFVAVDRRKTNEVVLQLPSMRIERFAPKDPLSTVSLVEGDYYSVSFAGIPTHAEFVWIDGEAHIARNYALDHPATSKAGRTNVVVEDAMTTALIKPSS